MALMVLVAVLMVVTVVLLLMVMYPHRVARSEHWELKSCRDIGAI
jgi:hypothetical protein